MSDMKCPICDTHLHKIPVKEAWVCSTHESKHELYGSKELWQELIRTRKALEIAKEGLKRIDWCATDYGVAQDILDEITALEQKDVK